MKKIIKFININKILFFFFDPSFRQRSDKSVFSRNTHSPREIEFSREIDAKRFDKSACWTFRL